jgi:hypothetical protein
MKKFALRIIAFFLLQALILAAFWNPALPFENGYLAATIDKHERLRKTRSPRIILVGGSNLAFGIKSKTLEDELGRPVVNMGLHADLGIPFMLREVKNEIRAGDFVVLSLEHDIFSTESTDSLSTQLVEMRPASLFLFPPDKQINLVDHKGFSIIGNVARRAFFQRYDAHSSVPSDRIYKRHCFDPQGSYTGHYLLTATRPRIVPSKISEMSEEIRAGLEEFARWCTARGARCFYTSPPHPTPFLDSALDRVERNQDQLRRIPNLVVLDSARDHAYATNLFYDSSYHLTEPGAELRTRKLVSSLRPFVTSATFASAPDRGAQAN